MQISLKPRRLLLLAALGIVAMATVGYAASNTVPGSNAGDGYGAVSGYTVSNIHYGLGSNPAIATSVTFDISPALLAGGDVRLSFDSGTTWTAAGDCTGTTSITCNNTNLSVASLQNLRIVAAQ